MRKKIIGLGVVVAILAALGIAFAAWTATGTGSGRAQSLSAQTLTVTADTGTADLYPGFTQGDLYFTVTNPNPYSVNFTSFTSGTVTSSDPLNCPSSNVTVTASGPAAVTVPGSANPSVQKSIPNIVTMSAAAPDGCQGKTFDVVLTLTGVST